MTARVVRVESDSDDPSWEITVAREDSHFYRTYPDARDAPADIRAALAGWLKTAEETP